jgi:hypothetical protein
VRNHNLALIFEARALNGKLLVSMSPLDKTDAAPAQCLLTAIKTYMNSSRFMPESEITETKLRVIFTK